MGIFYKYLFIIVLVIFCTGMTCIVNIPDLDLWARLIAGQHIVETLSVIKYDFLSYMPTHIWYDHEWGASIFFYLALKYFGDSGLIILKGMLISLTILMCYKTVELRNPKSTVSYNILYYAIMFFAVYNTLGATIRCLLFTCLFFSIFLYILEKARHTDNRYLIILPFLMVLWANIHGGCVSGLGLILIYIIGEYLNKKQIKNYIYTLIGCIFGLFINPYGIGYVKFLFSAALMNREYISEWVSPFHPKVFKIYMYYKFYLIIMLISALTYLIKNKIKYEKLDKTKILILLTVTILSVMKVRHQAFFIFTAGTLLYDEFYWLFNSLIAFIRKKLGIKNEETIKSFILLKEIIVYILLVMLSLPPLLNKNKEIKITKTKYPRFAVEFVKINNLKGNLFINFDWGSYAEYKLYPNNLVVMDGRYEEVYNPKLLLQLKDFHLVKNDWYKIIRDNKTDVIILEKEYPVYKKILNHKDWALVFENNITGVFVPADKLKQNYIMPEISDDYYNKTKFDTDIKFNLVSQHYACCLEITLRSVLSLLRLSP